MNRDEAIAEAYLRMLDMGDVVYEPDGNVTPDFLVGGSIAVEVRRLNQHVMVDGAPQGLEVAEAGILKYVTRLLPTLGRPVSGRSWWVSFHFRRPLDWKKLKKDIRKALTEVVLSDDRQTLRLRRNFEMDVAPALHPHPTRFVLGGYSDFEAGGVVGSEIIRNASLCIAEKSRKVAGVRDRHPEWWLLLVDRIGPQLNAFERHGLLEHIDADGWDRVMLLDPDDPARALRLGRRPTA